jgi:hypothetical protein
VVFVFSENVVYDRSPLLAQNTSNCSITEDSYVFTLCSSSQINLYFITRIVLSIYIEDENVKELLIVLQSVLRIKYSKCIFM